MRKVKGPRRLPAVVKVDLRWWLDLPPELNGLSFAEELNPIFLCFSAEERASFHLFTDVCDAGMGGFYYAGSGNDWRRVPFPVSNTFAIPHANHLAHEHINAHELRVIFLALSV